MNVVIEQIWGKGHRNIRATHPTTLAITIDPEVKRSGNCFLMVSADKSPRTLSEDFKNVARNPVKIDVEVIVEGLVDGFYCYGDPTLSFRDDRTMVFRKSSYVCDKTVGIRSSKGARDIDRSLVEKLKKGSEAMVKLKISF
jgi:hypothetical protein